MFFLAVFFLLLFCFVLFFVFAAYCQYHPLYIHRDSELSPPEWMLKLFLPCLFFRLIEGRALRTLKYLPNDINSCTIYLYVYSVIQNWHLVVVHISSKRFNQPIQTRGGGGGGGGKGRSNIEVVQFEIRSNFQRRGAMRHVICLVV